MRTFRIAVDISRPPADVFAILAEPHAMPQWYEAVDDVTKIPNSPSGTGAQYDVTRSLPGGRAHNRVELTDYEPDRRVTLESLCGPTPFRYRYTLEPTRRGTRLVLDGRISSAGLPGPLGRLDGVAARLFERGMRLNLDKLKRLIEAP